MSTLVPGSFSVHVAFGAFLALQAKACPVGQTDWLTALSVLLSHFCRRLLERYTGATIARAPVVSVRASKLYYKDGRKVITLKCEITVLQKHAWPFTQRMQQKALTLLRADLRRCFTSSSDERVEWALVLCEDLIWT